VARSRARTPSSGKPGAAPGHRIVPFVDEDLGNSAYLVASDATRDGVLIDPLRDVDRYLDAAKRARVTIAYVLDTHLHNDFVSGCREVAAATGAQVGASAEARLEFDHRPLREGDRISLDGMDLEVLATPGHTPEHVAFLLRVGDARPIALFSGGALIVGGAARTDLLGDDLAGPLARSLYRTIHGKLMTLPDDVAVYPTHGTGSFCAAPTVEARTTTIGLERERNALVQARGEDEFITSALSGLPSYPTYFRELRPINRKGPRVLRDLPRPTPLSPSAVAAWAEQGGAVLDVRPAKAYLQGHVPRAYGIPLDAPLVTWGGWLLPYAIPLVLVAEGTRDLEGAVRALVRIGFDEIRGHVKGGMAAWKAAGLPVERVRLISPADLRARIKSGEPPVVLDVRQDDEWAGGRIPGALHVENGRLPEIDLAPLQGRPVVVHCGTYNRSTAGLSVLARRGLRDLTLLDGGFAAWASSGFEIERGPGET